MGRTWPPPRDDAEAPKGPGQPARSDPWPRGLSLAPNHALPTPSLPGSNVLPAGGAKGAWITHQGKTHPPSPPPQTPAAEPGILSPVLSFPKAEYFGSAGASSISPLMMCSVKGERVMLSQTRGREDSHPRTQPRAQEAPRCMASYLYF